LPDKVLCMTLSYYFVMLYIYALLKMQNTNVIHICYQYSVLLGIVYAIIHVGYFSHYANNAYTISNLHICI